MLLIGNGRDIGELQKTRGWLEEGRHQISLRDDHTKCMEL